MKYILILLLALPILGLSQSRTTLEEYEYCTKDYKIQIKNGLDPVKKGYQTKKLYTYYSKTTTVEFLGLIKTATSNLQAILLIVKNTDEVDYYCMPNEFAKQEIWNMYYDRLGEEDNKRQQEIMMAFSNYIQAIGNTQNIKTTNRPIYDYKKRDEVAKKSEKHGGKTGTIYKKEDKLKTGSGDRKMYGEKSRRAKVSDPNNSYRDNNGRINSYVGGGLAGRKIASRHTPNSIGGQYGAVNLVVCVNPEGKVVEVRYTQRGSTTANRKLIEAAEKSAKKYKFESIPYAPDKQCGTITFKFLPG